MSGIATFFSSMSQGMGGLSYMNSSNSEAEALQAQAGLIEQEGYRDAKQKAREVSDFRSQQAIQYASSGVTLAGTPLEQLEDTRVKGQEEVDALMARAAAQASLTRQKAKMTKKAGRNAFLASIVGGIGSGLQGYTGKAAFAKRKQTGVNAYPYNIPQTSGLVNRETLN